MHRPPINELTDLVADASLAALEAEVVRRGSESLATLVWLAKIAREVAKEQPVLDATLGRSRLVGRFRLETLLGTGAYGAVFKAFDVELARHVALKLAWPRVLVDPAASRRFADEPRAMAAVKHPGIAEIYDAGECEMVSYIAMELVDGPTLAEWSKTQLSISQELAAHLIRSVAQAIHRAHIQGVVHRDIKPSNVLLRPTMQRAAEFAFEPVVTDFGLARQPHGCDASSMTGTAAVVGTDNYMSPEQAAGLNCEVGPWSDVFSLGVMLYELLAGRRPFDAGNGVQIRGQMEDRIPAKLHVLRTGVARDLDTIVAKCLQSAPGQRYSTAQALADDLDRFLNHEAIDARRATLMQRARRFARRERLAVALASFALVSALAIGGIAAAWVRDRTVASGEFAAATASADAAVKADEQRQYIANVQRASESLRVGRGRDARARLARCEKLPHAARGLEWDLLAAQTRDEAIHWMAHHGEVNAVRFSPQGDRLASAGKDGRVVVWDVESRQKVWEANDGMGEINAVEFSPEGLLIAAVGDDGRVVVRKIADRSLVLQAPAVSGRAFTVAWLGDSQLLAVGGDGKEMALIDVRAGSQRRMPIKNREAVAQIRGIVHLPGLNAIAVRIRPHGIAIVELERFSTLYEWQPAEGNGIGPMCRLPMVGEHLAFYERDLAIRVLDAANHVFVAEFALAGSASALCPTKGNILLAVSDSSAIEAIDVEQLRRNHPARCGFVACPGPLMRLGDISSDGRWVISGDSEGSLALRPINDIANPYERTCKLMPLAVKFSPCGRWLAVAEGNGATTNISMLDGHSGRELWSVGAGTFDRAIATESPLAFSPSGDQLVCWKIPGVVLCLDSSTGEVVKEYVADGSVPAVSGLEIVQFSPDGRSIIAYCGKRVLVLDQNSGDVLNTAGYGHRRFLGQHRTALGDLWFEWEGSGSIVARAALDGAVVKQWPSSHDHMKHLAVSSNGRVVACGGVGKTIHVYELVYGREPVQCECPEGNIYSLGFSSEGRTLLSLARDGRLRFWDWERGVELTRLGTPGLGVMRATVSPSSDALVVALAFNDTYGLRAFRLGANRDSVLRQLRVPAAADTAYRGAGR